MNSFSRGWTMAPKKAPKTANELTTCAPNAAVEKAGPKQTENFSLS